MISINQLSCDTYKPKHVISKLCLLNYTPSPSLDAIEMTQQSLPCLPNSLLKYGLVILKKLIQKFNCGVIWLYHLSRRFYRCLFIFLSSIN